MQQCRGSKLSSLITFIALSLSFTVFKLIITVNVQRTVKPEYAESKDTYRDAEYHVDYIKIQRVLWWRHDIKSRALLIIYCNANKREAPEHPHSPIIQTQSRVGSGRFNFNFEMCWYNTQSNLTNHRNHLLLQMAYKQKVIRKCNYNFHCILIHSVVQICSIRFIQVHTHVMPVYHINQKHNTQLSCVISFQFICRKVYNMTC